MSWGLESVVHFAGLQEEVRPYLATMDIYLITTDFEGLPIAMLEAMAMEISSVTTGVVLEASARQMIEQKYTLDAIEARFEAEIIKLVQRVRHKKEVR